jgi:ribosomal protein S18 acetylase RimI-like enzyme
MLFEAAHLAEEGETSVEAAMNHPLIARYVKNWGQPGDLGTIAEVDRFPVGAAWLRLLTGDEKGFGYVDDETPELAIAVLPNFRGQGIGTALLQHLLELAKAIYPAVCLNVRESNPAVRLYERIGFQTIKGSEIVNRTGGISYDMKLIFCS